MALDPDEPLTPKPAPKNLDIMAVAELEDYIAELEGEIARARRTIEIKRKIRGGADSLFKR